MKSGRVKVKFAVSDGTDSILAVYWPKPGEARPKALAAGAFVRVRGDVKPDRYEQDAEVATVLENLARLLHNTAREAEAQELEERAKSIRNGKKTL